MLYMFSVWICASWIHCWWKDIDIVVDRSHWPKLQQGLEASAKSAASNGSGFVRRAAGCRIFWWPTISLWGGSVGGLVVRSSAVQQLFQFADQPPAAHALRHTNTACCCVARRECPESAQTGRDLQRQLLVGPMLSLSTKHHATEHCKFAHVSFARPTEPQEFISHYFWSAQHVYSSASWRLCDWSCDFSTLGRKVTASADQQIFIWMSWAYSHHCNDWHCCVSLCML